MTHPRIRRIARGAAFACLVAGPAALTARTSTGNAASISALLAQAEHDTNTVHTLVHHDSSTVTSSSLIMKIVAHGAEDEVHNREQDFESVSITSKTGGTTRKVHYTLDIIFLNGLTYYKTQATHNKWVSHKGMTLTDPNSGVFKRARTTVTFPASMHFVQVSQSGGQTQVRAPFTQAGVAGTVDLWISSGGTPYVVREQERYHALKGKGTGEMVVNFGPFNTSLMIVPPTGSGSA